MNAVSVSTGNFVEEFDRIARQLPGGAHVLERRRAALARFSSVGLPTTRDEAWKYTDVSVIGRRTFRVSPSVDQVDTHAMQQTSVESAGKRVECVFVNGYYRSDLSSIDALPAGLSIRPLATAVGEDAKVDEHLFDRDFAAAPSFVALNVAFSVDGAYVTIADNAIIDTPVHLVFNMVGEKDTQAYFPRVVVKAGKGSRARVVETYRGAPNVLGLTNTLTEIIAAEGACVEHYKVQDESSKTFHVGNLIVDQGCGSEVTSHSFSFGALLARHDIHVTLSGEAAGTTLNGLYMANGRQHVDHHTRIDHLQPHTRSDEYYKGILAGHGRGVFNGKVIVHPQAFKTDAQQSNKNLLLSEDAEVDTKPELEIYAGDVKCAHGATVGQLDANVLFYLRTRGLDEPTARGLLTYAFAGDIVNRITIERLRRELAARVAGQLPDALHLLEAL